MEGQVLISNNFNLPKELDDPRVVKLQHRD
jgi:hypothetical protein